MMKITTGFLSIIPGAILFVSPSAGAETYDGFRCALTELDVDVIPRAQHWNLETREKVAKQDPYADGCPDEVLEQAGGGLSRGHASRYRQLPIPCRFFRPSCAWVFVMKKYLITLIVAASAVLHAQAADLASQLQGYWQPDMEKTLALAKKRRSR
jgi:hypothetical protein